MADGRSPAHIIITGASSGIGHALALRYAAPGVVLGLTGRNADRLREIADLCTARGARVETTLTDVTDRDGMRAWLLSFDAAHPVDLLIANAGVSAGTGGPSGENEDQVRAIFDVNVLGVFNTIHPLLPAMQARRAGHIAIMASLAGFAAFPGAPAYGASKGAVRLYGESLHGAVKDDGVCVSVICPGFVESRMTAVNDYKMPFLMSADRAAGIIMRGLAKRRIRIAFPWQTYALAGFIGLLPAVVTDRILARLPKKQIFAD